MARWLHIRQAGSFPPGTDRSAWADGAGSLDGRWPFHQRGMGRRRRKSDPAPPPLESGCPLGGPPGPGGGDGAFQAGASSFGWLVSGSGKTATANECPALAGLFTCTEYLDSHATFEFWCCLLRPVRCEPVCLFDIVAVCSGHPPIFADWLFPLPSLPSFPLLPGSSS